MSLFLRLWSSFGILLSFPSLLSNLFSCLFHLKVFFFLQLDYGFVCFLLLLSPNAGSYSNWSVGEAKCYIVGANVFLCLSYAVVYGPVRVVIQ